MLCGQHTHHSELMSDQFGVKFQSKHPGARGACCSENVDPEVGAAKENIAHTCPHMSVISGESHMFIHTSINTNQATARDHKIDLGGATSVPIISCGDSSGVLIHEGVHKSQVAVGQPLEQGSRALQRGVIAVIVIMRHSGPHSQVIQTCTHLYMCVNPNDQFQVPRDLRVQKSANFLKNFQKLKIWSFV